MDNDHEINILKQRISLPVSLTRRRCLQLAALAGAGVGVTVLIRTVFNPLTEFEFKVITVNAKGEVIDIRSSQAGFFSEDLGSGVSLEMVSIPGGTFKMGSSEGEEGSREDERPQREVRIQPLLIGKFQVTQAQWRAVASLPKVDRDLDPDPSSFNGVVRGGQDLIALCSFRPFALCPLPAVGGRFSGNI